MAEAVCPLLNALNFPSLTPLFRARRNANDLPLIRSMPTSPLSSFIDAAMLRSFVDSCIQAAVHRAACISEKIGRERVNGTTRVWRRETGVGLCVFHHLLQWRRWPSTGRVTEKGQACFRNFFSILFSNFDVELRASFGRLCLNICPFSTWYSLFCALACVVSQK